MEQPISKDKLTIGWWLQENASPEAGRRAIRSAIMDLNRPVVLVYKGDKLMVCREGKVIFGGHKPRESGAYPLAAYLPPLPPENLGDPLFKKQYHLRFAYIAGAMANGITSVEMVEAAGRAGMIGFFGSAGLSPGEVEAAIIRLRERMGSLPFGSNLIYSPNEPELEAQVVELYLKHGITLVSASAYMEMTLPLIYYRVRGIHRNDRDEIVSPNRIIAKVSRVEVARKFFSPPPEKFLKQLLDKNMITQEESELARKVPVAEVLSAEADSGGHTDNRPAITLLPTMLAVRDEAIIANRYHRPLFVGLGGGIATPESAAAAFAMGAAYVLTGSVNQSCVEAGTSETVREMLAETTQADVVMAPAADMFEMGVKVQVLKRGTMFPFRAARLYDIYCRYDCYEAIPDKEKAIIERDFFRCGFQEEWERTRLFFNDRDPSQVQRAETDTRHKMALVFRSYLGRSSGWANSGEPSRKLDYQIWCGPAMGAFNEWVKGSFLEKTENRKIATVALNLLTGAAVTTRVNWLRSQGVVPVEGIERFSPMELTKIEQLVNK